MNVLMFVALVLGFLVLALAGVILATMAAYSVAAIIVMVVLEIKLNTKPSPKPPIQFLGNLNQDSNKANSGAYSGWPAKYVKYVISNYFQIVWGRTKVGYILYCLRNSEYRSRYNQGLQKVINGTLIPVNKPNLKPAHCPNSNTGAKDESTKSKQNQKHRP